MIQDLVLPQWLPSRKERREAERALAQKYFLVRIAGNSGYDKMRCTRCGVLHTYLTLMCKPQPFNGASRGIHLYFRQLGVAGAEKHLDPLQKARVKTFEELLGPFGKVPDLSTSHPETARKMQVSMRDGDSVSVEIGELEEIPKTLAQKFLDDINDTGIKPPLEVKGLVLKR